MPVTINTDLPARLAITIGHEYGVAAAMGFDQSDLLSFTRNAVRALFTSPERKTEVLAEIETWV